MGFYEELSRYYDQVFPVEAADMEYINKALQGAGRVLDIGCGTGNKTVLLAAKGRTVLGIDSDPAMIARADADNVVQGVSYEVLDMRDLGARFHKDAFDGVVCLGNTLAHLDGLAAISGLVEEVARILEKDGVVVLQILNYDRILDQNIRALPVLEGKNVRFERYYEPEGPRLHFRTRLSVKASGEHFGNDVLLYPLRRGELDAMLLASGFSGVEWYGGFRGEPYDGVSLPALVICRK